MFISLFDSVFLGAILFTVLGVYPSTLTNVFLWKKIEFYNCKSDSEAIIIAAWHLRQSPSGVQWEKPQFFFWLFVFNLIKRLKA